MIEPVIRPFTTSGFPDSSTNSMITSSAMLPNDTVSKPPRAGPDSLASCSVARRMYCASGTMAAVAIPKVHNDCSPMA
jgi:hypothetical protein